MRKKMSRTILVTAFLAASLAMGAAPSYAEMLPPDAGISDADWARVVEIGDYNGAYSEYVDNTGESVLVFTGGNVPDELQMPADFTGFDDPNLTLYGEYSQFSTNDQITAVMDDAITQLQTAGYSGGARYNPDTDVVDVTTLAPSSTTDSLVITYGSKISIISGDPEGQSAPGGAAHGSTKTHPAKKHAAKKQASAKPAKKPAKTASAPAPAPQEPTKVALTLSKP